MSKRYTLIEAMEMIARMRHSAKGFGSKPVPRSTLRNVLELAQLAPSSFNLQPFKLLLVSSVDAREVLSSSMVAGNGRKVSEAPVSIVFLSFKGNNFCAMIASSSFSLISVTLIEPYRLTNALMQLEEAHGADPAYVQSLPVKLNFLLGPGWLSHKIRELSSHLASPLTPSPTIPYGAQWSVKNSMFAAQQLLLACAAHGLVSAPMEGFDERRICFQLGVPIDHYSVPLVVALGYAAGEEECSKEASSHVQSQSGGDVGHGEDRSQPGPKKVRFKLEDICYENRYGHRVQF
jgi:nitroreductase